VDRRPVVQRKAQRTLQTLDLVVSPPTGSADLLPVVEVLPWRTNGQGLEFSDRGYSSIFF
jgi:hypothetical protein